MVEVTSDKIKHSFSADTSMSWNDFTKRAYERFREGSDDVRLGYRITGDTRAMSYLGCGYDWNFAMGHLKERVIAARTRPVGMELKNMVSVNSFESGKKNSHFI
jgi:hypothetical protein